MDRAGTPAAVAAAKELNGVVSGSDLEALLRKPDLSERLVITPLLDKKQVGPSSIDVRLGNQFIVFKREKFDILDVARVDDLRNHLDRYQQRVIRAYGDHFVLHPRELVIGSTLEYIVLPPKLMCYVIGTSSWGRMGLIIATATKVDPGFRGCIALEIVNEGEIPIVLYPGLPIAQLVFHTCTGPDVYGGRYSCPVGPEFPRFNVDARWRYWLPKNKKVRG
jgi:dCTP deaminase